MARPAGWRYHEDVSRIRAAVASLLALGAVVACGGASSSEEERHVLNSKQDLCAGAIPDYGDHIATMVSCSFVQHTDNIAKFGDKLTAPLRLVDGTGREAATITQTCDVWLAGKDAQGIVVLVRRDTGLVVSHGSQHKGQETSQLPAQLALPLATHE